MRRIVDNEELKIVWGLDKWYEKTIFVLGVIYVTALALAFIIGFIIGLTEG